MRVIKCAVNSNVFIKQINMLLEIISWWAIPNNIENIDEFLDLDICEEKCNLDNNYTIAIIESIYCYFKY